VLDEAGFAKVRWGRQIDVFSGSKHESDAKDFDTHGVTFAGVKAARARGRQWGASRGAAAAVGPGAECEIPRVIRDRRWAILSSHFCFVLRMALVRSLYPENIESLGRSQS